MRVFGAIGVSAVLVLALGSESWAAADAPARRSSPKVGKNILGKKKAGKKKAGKKKAGEKKAGEKKAGKKKAGKKKAGKKSKRKPKRKAHIPGKRRGNKGKKTKRPPKSISPLVREALEAKKHRAAPQFNACSASLPEMPPGQLGAVLDTAYAWPNGSTLRIGFADGSLEARKAVRDMANQWTDHANLDFDFVLADDATDLDIRILFDSTQCNSKVGTGSRYAAEMGGVTMNLCHMDEQIGSARFQRVVLHEFGHAMGLRHEHQNPNVEFEWNYDYVYDYYAKYAGWTRAQTDMWVLNPKSPGGVLASKHDPDSVMHYTFPPEFTKDGTSFGGKNAISALDAEHVAQWYPRKSKDKVRTYQRRKLAVWNRTAEPITVKVVYETKKKGTWAWSPSSKTNKGKSLELGPGMKAVVPKASGRRAKLLATNDFGDRWTLDEQLAASYEARKMETFTLEVEGAPDTPPSKSPDELYESGTKALEAGKYKLARKRFRAFAKRYPSDDRVAWARFNVMLAWYQAGHYNRSIQAGYDLIIDMPDATASDFAWFYGGAASFELGHCDNAQAYFEFVSNPDFGLPKDWQEGARHYLETIENESDKFCR